MMIRYVRDKIDWVTRGKEGRQPDFGNYARGSPKVNLDEADKPPVMRN